MKFRAGTDVAVLLLLLLLLWDVLCGCGAHSARSKTVVQPQRGHVARVALRQPLHDPVSAVYGLIERRIPSLSGDFVLSEISKGNHTGFDQFELADCENNTVCVKGSSATALAFGLKTYLQNYCHVQWSWSGDQLDSLPSHGNLPKVGSSGVRMERSTEWSYYENVCTVSYSMAWWTWERWEREIDWMALNGINMALAFAGQESIWATVFEQMGVSQAGLDAFFAGPAFLAWQRMGNMRGWGGPLSSSWNDQQMIIQKKTVDRMRELGILSILPAFAGHVPEELTVLFPNSSFSQSARWGGFNDSYCCDYLLAADDPLFNQIGKAFVQAQIEVYGSTDHAYNCDTFNEMDPPSSDPKYLRDYSAAVYSSMAAGDPQAVWVMQGWLFQHSWWTASTIEALLSGVANEKMLILDLYAEFLPVYSRSESFYGKPFIWCMLHNFGGNLGLFGSLQSLNEGPSIARGWPSSTMQGVGLTPEGINQNYIVYDFVLDSAWRDGPVDLDDWISDFVLRRYGAQEPGATAAWLRARSVVFEALRGGGVTKSMTVLRPALSPHRHTFMPTDLYYKRTDLVAVWEELLSGNASGIAATATYRYDICDWTRQVLSDYFPTLLENFNIAYELGEASEVERVGDEMLELISDMDTVMASNEHFLLGRWIEDAKSFGKSPEDIALLEMNARNLVSLWGPSGEHLDYASKQWAGLLGDYYLERWTMFVQSVLDAVKAKIPFSQDDFVSKCFAFEKAWQLKQNVFPVEPVGESVGVVLKVHSKWVERLRG